MLTKAQARWVREASAILDEMEKHPPSEEELAPFRTKTWIAKGRGFLGIKHLGCLALIVLLAGCLGRDNSVNLFELRVLDELRQINFTLEQGRDTRHPVEIARPDIWNRMFAD